MHKEDDKNVEQSSEDEDSAETDLESNWIYVVKPPPGLIEMSQLRAAAFCEGFGLQLILFAIESIDNFNQFR